MADFVQATMEVSRMNRSLNTITVQYKNCPFGANTTIQLRNITATSDSNVIYRGVFWLKSVPVLSEVTYFLSSYYSLLMEIFVLCHCCIQWALWDTIHNIWVQKTTSWVTQLSRTAVIPNLGVRVTSGVRTRTFSGTRKKIE